jgi:signal transduction histidine kinase
MFNFKKLVFPYLDKMDSCILNGKGKTYVAIEKDENLSLEEKQQKATEMVKTFRYGPENKDYFWINDRQPTMVMHPYKPDLDSKNLSGFKDPNDK